MLVLKCNVRTRVITFDQLTPQDALDLSPTLVCLVFSAPCRHVSPADTR